MSTTSPTGSAASGSWTTCGSGAIGWRSSIDCGRSRRRWGSWSGRRSRWSPSSSSAPRSAWPCCNAAERSPSCGSWAPPTASSAARSCCKGRSRGCWAGSSRWALLRRVHSHQPLAHPGSVLLERPGACDRRIRHADWALRQCRIRRQTLAKSMTRSTKTSRRDVTQKRRYAHGFARRFCVTILCYAFFATSLASQRPQPFDQPLRDNQQRLESIRRERSDVEQELERRRTQAHSLSDELANIERQKETTNRIVNELDRQIYALSDQIDRTTVDLLLAQDALAEKRAVLERRLVDIYKRGPLYAYQVLLAAESFGDLLSRYKYLYLVSRQDRLLANDMSKLQRRIGRL